MVEGIRHSFDIPPLEGEPQRGHLELVCGGMFSGKTEELIRRITRHKIALVARNLYSDPEINKQILVLKPKYDRRNIEHVIKSHSKHSFPAEYFDEQNPTEILNMVTPHTRVVAIDEIQFVNNEIIEVCDTLVVSNRVVICAGLDLDFAGEPFGPVPDLMTSAEICDKLHAICTVCGDPASRTQRLINGKPAHPDDAIFLLGAEDVYQARCRGCHEVVDD